MKIITRAVLDWDGNVLEEDSYEYSGPVADCKSSGSAPQPVDPYTQANAQYGLATGTANYNAALNRTGETNPLGSSSWNVTGYSGAPSSSGGASAPTPYGYGGRGGYSPGSPSAGGAGGIPNGSGAPLYTHNTSLTPWANDLLSKPIDTSQIPGMPGGPSLQQNVGSAENAVFNQQMDLLAPQEKQQQEQTQAQLENEGAMPGSAAYDYGEQSLARAQGAQNAQVANQAVTTGMGELPMLYGLGSTSLQNQLAERNAPISEFEALQGNGAGGNVSAATPDMSGAFNNQYQGALAGYNANTATNNANTQAGTGLLSSYLMYLTLSDKRAKTDIKKVGELDSGPGIYTYRYKGSEKPQIGVMAQELEKTHPEAVFSLGGTKFVDYRAI